MTQLDEMKTIFSKLNLEHRMKNTKDCKHTLVVYDNFGQPSSFFFNEQGQFQNLYYYEDAACYDASVENDMSYKDE